MKNFENLFKELEEKVSTGAAGSRTVAEYEEGVHEVGKKILEEAGEVWMAAEHESREETCQEISQLLYHIQVLMLVKGLSLEDINRHL